MAYVKDVLLTVLIELHVAEERYKFMACAGVRTPEPFWWMMYKSSQCWLETLNNNNKKEGGIQIETFQNKHLSPNHSIEID